jgi:hypothetical protein
LEERRLPGAIGADDHDRLTRVDTESHVVDDIIAQVSGREAVDLKHV